MVWWDPHALTLGVEASFGIRREALIMKDVAPVGRRRRAARLRAMESGRAEAIAAGSSAVAVGRTATEWAADPASTWRRSVQPAQRLAGCCRAVQAGLFDEPSPDRRERRPWP